MPGWTAATGGETSDSEAVIPFDALVEILGVGVCEATGVSSPDSPLMVDVEEDRVNVCVKGARCVSFNFLVIFQDIVEGGLVSRRRGSWIETI
jgi:hypothetical protein